MYEDLRDIYDHVMKRETFSISEMQAITEELGTLIKSKKLSYYEALFYFQQIHDNSSFPQPTVKYCTIEVEPHLRFFSPYILLTNNSNTTIANCFTGGAYL